MILEIQQTIPNVPYSVNKQTIDTQGMTPEQVEKEIALAKLLADMVAKKWQEQPVLNAQEASENEMLRKANEGLDLVSAQKSVIIDALKREIGEERYAAVREETVKSDQFKSLTLHANDPAG